MFLGTFPSNPPSIFVLVNALELLPIIVNLTTPCSVDGVLRNVDEKYQKSYSIASRLLKVLGGSEFKFKNPNTSRDIAHISLSTELFTPVYNNVGMIHMYSSKMHDEHHVKNNTIYFNQLLQQVTPILDQIKKA